MLADLFGRAAWQIRYRAGVEVFADLPLDAAGSGESALALNDSLAKQAPFDGLSMGPGVFLAGALPPGGAAGPAGWDPRTPRRARAAVERAGLLHRLYCPARLPEDTQALADLRPYLSASRFPYVRR